LPVTARRKTPDAPLDHVEKQHVSRSCGALPFPDVRSRLPARQTEEASAGEPSTYFFNIDGISVFFIWSIGSARTKAHWILHSAAH
jgi:hypothetical protein